MEEKYGGRFRAIHILEQGKADYAGRPNADMIGEIAKSVDLDNDAEFYICGPQPMMDIVSDGLKTINVE